MIFLVLASVGALAAAPSITLYPGYVTRLRCEGRLLVSAVGDDRLVRLETLPKELGCGIVLKPMAGEGRSNLLLETSAGSFEAILQLAPGKRKPEARDLTVSVSKGGVQ